MKRGITAAKRAFTKMKHVLTNRRLSIENRKRLVKVYVWSVLCYGSEAWNINKEAERKIEAAEMFFWRRLLKVSWTERKTNERILQMMNTERELLRRIRGRQMESLGHVMRREEIENICLTGRIEGTRARGRQREKFMDGLTRECGGIKAGRLLQLTRNRWVWKSMTANVFEGTAHR